MNTIYLFFWQPRGVKGKIKAYTLIAFAVVVVSSVVVTYFPSHLGVYVSKLGGYVGEGDLSSEVVSSDAGRVYFFVEALKSIFNSPLGHGLALMYTDEYGYHDPHNIFSGIIWAGGFFGLVWVIFVIPVGRKYLFFKSNYQDEMSAYSAAFKVGILSWVLNNMTHNSLNMGALWVIVGLQIYLGREGYFQRVEAMLGDKRAYQNE